MGNTILGRSVRCGFFLLLAACGLRQTYAQDSSEVVVFSPPTEIRDSLEAAARREQLRDSVYLELPNFTAFSQCESVAGFTEGDIRACKDRLSVAKPYLEEQP